MVTPWHPTRKISPKRAKALKIVSFMNVSPKKVEVKKR